MKIQLLSTKRKFRIGNSILIYLSITLKWPTLGRVYSYFRSHALEKYLSYFIPNMHTYYTVIQRVVGKLIFIWYFLLKRQICSITIIFFPFNICNNYIFIWKMTNKNPIFQSIESFNRFPIAKGTLNPMIYNIKKAHMSHKVFEIEK